MRKESGEAVIQLQFKTRDFKQPLLEWVRSLEPCADSGQNLADHVAIRIGSRQAMRLEIATKAAQRIGQQVIALVQQEYDVIAETGQRNLRPRVKIAGEQMVEPDVDEDSGIAPKWRLEQCTQCADIVVTVGEHVDRPVQRNSLPNAHRQGWIDAAAYKITQQAAQTKTVIGAGQQGVGKVIHKDSERGPSFTVSCAP